MEIIDLVSYIWVLYLLLFFATHTLSHSQEKTNIYIWSIRAFHLIVQPNQRNPKPKLKLYNLHSYVFAHNIIANNQRNAR